MNFKFNNIDVDMRQQLPPDLLRSFVTIAEEGSFQEAANRIGRTQSAVSMQVQRLEQMVGHRLFRRERPTVSLTAKGEALLGYARRILALQEEAFISMTQPEPEGVLRFGIPDDYAGGVLPRILESFAACQPRMEIAVHCAPSVDLAALIKEGALDLAVVTRPLDGNSGQLIGREQLVWVSSYQHAAHLQDVLPLAVFREDCDIRRWATQSLANSGRNYRVAYSSPNLSALLAMTGAGLAVAVMPRSSVPKSLRILGKREGFPALPTVGLMLLRNPAGISPGMDAMAAAIDIDTDVVRARRA